LISGKKIEAQYRQYLQIKQLQKKTLKDSDLSLPLISFLKSTKIDWKNHLEMWDFLVTKNPLQVAQLVRRGIPSEIRGEAWKVITGANLLKFKNQGVYELLLKKKSDVEEYLFRDIDRTFPGHKFFKKDGNGQQALFNVLKVFSLLDHDVGYCQGMSYLTGVLVTQLSEPDAFWVLTSLLKSYNFRGLFLNELPLLNLYLYRFSYLITHFLPNLASHFYLHGIKPLFYSSEWFSTLFSYNMDFELTCRIWDILFLEGEDYLFKVGLAILKISEIELLALEFEDIMLFLKNRTLSLDLNVLKVADSFPNLSIFWQFIDKKYEEENSHKLDCWNNYNNNQLQQQQQQKQSQPPQKPLRLSGQGGVISRKKSSLEESGYMFYSAVVAKT